MTAASGSRDRLLLWNLQDWLPRTLNDLEAVFNALAFSPDGLRLAALRPEPWGLHAAITPAREILLCDLQTGTRTVFSTDGRVISLAISPDGKWLASGDWDGQLSVWELGTQKRTVANLQAHRSLLLGLAFSWDGATLATGGVDGIQLWRAGTAQKLGSLQGHRTEVWSLEYSRDGEWLVSASKDGTAKLWSAKPQKIPGDSFKVPTNCTVLACMRGGTAVATREDESGALRLWSLPDGQLLRSFEARNFREYGCARVDLLDAEDACGGMDTNGAFHCWSLETGDHLFSAELGETNVIADFLSPDRRWLLGTGPGRGMVLYDLRAGRRSIASKAPNFVAFSPDSAHLAYVASSPECAKLWDLRAEREKATFCGDRWGVSSLGFSADSKVLATGGDENDVWLWLVATGKQLPGSPLKGHPTMPRAVVFSRDGKTLVTSGADWTVRFWNIAAGQEMLTLEDLRLISAAPYAKRSLEPFVENRLVLQDRKGLIQVKPIPALAEIDAIESAAGPY